MLHTQEKKTKERQQQKVLHKLSVFIASNERNKNIKKGETKNFEKKKT